MPRRPSTQSLTTTLRMRNSRLPLGNAQPCIISLVRHQWGDVYRVNVFHNAFLLLLLLLLRCQWRDHCYAGGGGSGCGGRGQRRRLDARPQEQRRWGLHTHVLRYHCSEQMRKERKRKTHFLKLCSSSSGTNQKQVRRVGLLVVPEEGGIQNKNKVLSRLRREVPEPLRRTVLTRRSSTHLSHTLGIVSQTPFFFFFVLKTLIKCHLQRYGTRICLIVVSD